MKPGRWLILLAGLMLTACGPATPGTNATPSPAIVVDITATPQPPATPTGAEVPTAEPGEMALNPLTGLPPAAPELLERRPIIVKVQNVPRESRPQWGLSFADIVYEYYIEYGDTRFAAIYYGQECEQVGPIRSARHVDARLIRMYKSMLIFGGAYEDLLDELLSTDFGSRLFREGPNTEPAIFRYDPKGVNYLMVNTTLLDQVYAFYGADDLRQDLSGMTFDAQTPPNGAPGETVFVQFSGGMYHYWQFDANTGRYLRFSETRDDVNRNNPDYAPHLDRLTGEQLAADNVVILMAGYTEVIAGEQIFDIYLEGSGPAYLFRDGQVLSIRWQVDAQDKVPRLVDEAGNQVAYRPGNTWYEIVGLSSLISSEGSVWNFAFLFP